MRVLAEIKRSPQPSANGFPQMNMFDQPELEAMLRANLKTYPNAELGAMSRSPASPRPSPTGSG